MNDSSLSASDSRRAERASLVAEAERIIREGSKSFRFSSNLFDQATRERAWLLYSWCRACDDLADGQTLGHGAAAPADPERRIAFIRDMTARALTGERVGIAPFDALRVVAAECAIPRRFIDDHLAGFALDAEGWRPQSEEDLLLYCYHVAGAVGCMMAVVMGVAPDEEDTLDRAADLGIAFQLANIARDIVEDHGVGRVYLPAEWLPASGMDPDDRPALAAIAQRLEDLVERYEASARIGAARLPFRARWAVLSAANIYGAIARRVAARGAEAWDSRTIIHKPSKLLFVAKALIECGEHPAAQDRAGLWTRRP
jgi:phytoene synthase